MNASDLTATLTASPTSAPINTMVTLTCMAFENDTITEVAIANVTWQQGNNALPVDSNSTSIQVTADAPGNVNFTCTLTDDQGQSAVASVLVEFFNNASGRFVKVVLCGSNSVRSGYAFSIVIQAKLHLKERKSNLNSAE